MGAPKIILAQLYRAEIWPTDIPGYWGYLIVDPRGDEHCAGRRRGQEAEVREHLATVLGRLNLDIGSSVWNNQARKRAMLSAAWIVRRQT